MSNLKFQPTHRMLVKATTEHNYETVDIDINNGTFKRSSVKMTETKIRVNKSILGEILNLGGKSKPLGLDEIEAVANNFNEVRVTAGFNALNFRTTEERPDGEVPKTPKIQRKKATKARVCPLLEPVLQDASSAASAN